MLWIGLALLGRSQDASTILVGTEAQYGFLLPHRPHMHSLIKGHIYGTALYAEWRGGKEKEWKSAYQNPAIGAEFQWMNLGNPDQLGNSYTGFLCMGLPLDRGEKLRSNFRMGIGFSALSKRYHLDENPKNLAIGSAVNGAIFLNYQLSCRLHQNWIATASWKLTHYSNGAFQVPNLGLNLITGGIGLAYSPEMAVPAEKHRPEKPQDRLYVVEGMGVKENFPPLGRKYPALSLGIGYDKRISYKLSVGLRLDAFYSTAVKASLEDDGQDGSFGNTLRSGIAAGFAQHFGKMLIRFQTGAYLYDRYDGDGRIYNRFLIEQMLNDHWFAAVGLKTHFAKADHFEFGLGWRR